MFFTRYCQPPSVAISCAEIKEPEETHPSIEKNSEDSSHSQEKKQEIPLATTVLVQEGF